MTHSKRWFTRSLLSLVFALPALSLSAQAADCYTPGFACQNQDTQLKGSRPPSFGTDSGAANAYVLTTIAPLGPTLRTGSKFIFFAAHANTSASTLNVDSTGALAIKKSVSTALASGDILLNGLVEVVYDGTNFQCLNCGSSSSGSGGGFVGVNVQTSNYTLVSGDSGKLIVMNCSSSCTVTMYGSPTSTYWGWVISIGSSTATVSLNSTTFNGSSSVPALLKFQPLSFWSDGTNYYGQPELVAGSGISFTAASNGLTVALTSSSITINGTSCTLGSTCTLTSAPNFTFVDHETPSGTINGSNTAFTVAHIPVSGSEICNLNGLSQRSGAGNDYTISSASITYLTAPATGDTLDCSYRY